MKKIRVGIIGQGRSGRDIHRHLFECSPLLQERFQVVAVADPIPERRANSNPGADPACRQYADYRELLQDKDMDLVINASRSHKHVDISIEAMEAGHNVISEKPLAAKVSEVDRVLAAARRTGKFFAVYQQSRFRPLYVKMCEVIRSSVLGEIAMVKVRYNGFGRRWDWQTIQDLNGGELLNTAPHPLDQLVALWETFGDTDPERIFAKLANFNNYGDGEDFVKVILEGKGHPLMDLEVTKECLFPTATYQVYGKNGSLSASGNTVEWKYFVPSEAGTHTVSIAPIEKEGRLPVYCGEKLQFYNGKCTLPDAACGADDWGTKYYLNIYDVLTKGAELEVKLSQVRRQIAIIEECHRQNPLPKTVVVPPGTI